MKWIFTKIAQFFLWLARSKSIPVPLRALDILPRAKEVVAKWDMLPGKSGEWKRHQAYAQLLKEFRKITDKRTHALAIELAQWPY